jgi:signal transduction histidine kinase/CheY-like chemotaxis protein
MKYLSGFLHSFPRISKHSVAYRMLIYILSTGCLIMLLAISITIYFRYQDDLQNYNQELTDIQNTCVENIQDELQEPDNVQRITNELNNILKRSFIEYVEVRTDQGTYLAVGEKILTDRKEIVFPLHSNKETQNGQKIGELYILTKDQKIFENLWQTVTRDILFMITVIMATSLTFFLGFEFLIARHLQDLVSYTNRNNTSQSVEPFKLNRKNPYHPDELGSLVKSLNRMYARLFEALENLQISNRNLALEIDERKQAEYALEEEQTLLARRVEERTIELSSANASLSRAAKMKDEFMASMSHELRTPLAGILGLSEALASQVYGEINDRQKNAINQIHQSGDMLLKTINDIIDLSRIQTNQIELDKNPFEIENLCQSCIRLIKLQAIRKNISVSTNIEKPGLIVRSDERRLKQILVNLLNNAIKFTPENGKIGLDVMTDVTNQLISISIWDTGIGISEEGQKLLFQPFKQLDGGLSRRFSGSGLGLALVINLAKLLGGGVKVNSNPGQGSRFTITLPWDIEFSNSPQDKTIHPLNYTDYNLFHQEFQANNHRIMIVDDNELSLVTLRDYLVNLGARVIICQNSTEALTLIEDNPPDILLMDILLPDMDGLEIIQRLRQDEKTASIYIIALTALALEGDRRRCLEAGANEYFAKPFPYQTLAAAIYDYLIREKQNPSSNL